VVNIEATNAPVFLRFLNLLINDSTYMLDEALNYMSKIKQVEQERPSWASLPEEQRQEKERDYHHQGEIARYHNILGRETIQCLKSLTKFRNPARILLNSVMVDRLASMLNYFLHCLVGADKRSQYKVKDLEHYSFKPRDLVEKICAVYVNLGRHDARKDFFLAICRDKRSYNPQLFREAQKVLDAFCRTNGDTGDLIDGIGQLAHSVQLTEAAENEEEELLTDEDVPDEFLDPIMSHLMRDPVHLPSSGKIVDRSTIARILLSDQSDPFNRQPLTMDLVKPADDLRKEIEAWIQKRRDAKNNLTK
jgi:ubiquitin conjugation factor E4 A